MWSFLQRRVDTKILLGYLTILVLLLAVAIWQIRSMDAVSRSTDILVTRLATSREVTGHITTLAVLLEQHASLYQTTGNQIDLDQANRNLVELNTLLAQPDPALPPAIQTSLSDLSIPLQEYARAFAEIAALVQRRQQIESGTLSQQELIIENGLSSLRIHTTRTADTVLFLAYGNLQRAFGDLRLNLQDYMASGDERYTVLFQRSHQLAQNSAANLIPVLADRSQQDNMFAILSALEIYEQTFNMLRSDRVRMEILRDTELESNISIIRQTAASANMSVEADFRAQSDEIRQLYLQNRQGLMGAAILSILLSLTFGTILARRITQPLHTVMETSQQVATVDLDHLSRQLTSLSQGDTALSMGITTPPLAQAIVTQTDEVGRMAAAFNQIILKLEETQISFQAMSAYLQAMAESAHRVAHGDLTVTITPRSQKDVLGNALRHMIANLATADQRIKHQLARLSILRQLDSLITSTRDLGQILDYALSQGSDQLRLAGGEVVLWNPETQSIRIAARWGRAMPTAQSGPGQAAPKPYPAYVGHILTNGRTLLHTPTLYPQDGELFATDLDLATDFGEKASLIPPGCGTYIGVPLKLQNQVRGLIHFFDTEEIHLSHAQMHFAQTLGGQIAIALENRDLLDNLERRVAQRTQELEEARRFSAAVVDNSPTAIVVVDLDSRIADWNPAAESMFGYGAEEVLGRYIDDIVAGPHQKDEARELSETMKETKFRTFTRRVRRDGTIVDVEIAGVPVIVDGRHTASLAIYHDITDLQQARLAAEQATRAKSSFLAMMSHEIRTPMNAVIGMTNLLLQTPLTSEQMDFAQTVKTSGEALLGIINDILDFSKIEAGHMTLEDAPLDLRACVGDALDMLSPWAVEKGIELVAAVDPGCPGSIRGDVTRLRQILVNLVGNGIKFTEQGEVVVSVSAKLTEPDTPENLLQELHFSVRDTGLGVPQDKIDRLFRSFSQVDTSTTRRYGGTGLGLAISKRLCELMGGRIWVESSGIPGEGTTFHFTINARFLSGRTQPWTKKDLDALGNRRCLVVDDNSASLESLTQTLTAWGMQVSTCEKPVAALGTLRREAPFDLVLIDQVMPEMTGVDLATALRALPGYQKAAVVLMVPLGAAVPGNPGVFNATVGKPINSDQLAQTVSQILRAKGQVIVQTETIPGRKLDPEMAQWLPLRILLVEDNAINMRLAVTVLQRMGYMPDVASNGQDAVNMATTHPYDLILMDMIMPEMDGLEAARLIRQKVPARRQPYMVAVTANVIQEDRLAYLASGMDAYLAKPFSLEELTQTLLNCPILSDPEPLSAQ